MEEGQSFSAALASATSGCSTASSSAWCAPGKRGATCADALDRIVEMREKREALLAQVRAALAYPVILGVLSVVVVIFVLTGVLPEVHAAVRGQGRLLPASTRLLMAASQSLGAYGGRTAWAR